MATQTFGSVAAMEFRRAPRINFADIVEEFDIAFQMVDAESRALIWESDTVALIDRDGLRVGLGWQPGKEKGQRSHLVVAVGTRPGAKPCRVAPGSYDYVIDRIVERMRHFLPFTAVLRGAAGQPIGADMMQTLFDLLRADTHQMPGDKPAARKGRNVWEDAEIDAYADMVDEMAPAWRQGAKRAGHGGERPEAGPAPDAGDRLELSSPFGAILLERAKPTKPLRLTIHTLALSLCLYAPPVGAAMFAYTMLRDVASMAA